MGIKMYMKSKNGSSHRISSQKRLNILIPAHNEEEVLSPLFSKLDETCKLLYEKFKLSYIEVIVVDDGSTDQTYEILCGTSLKYADLKILSLSRNFGHQNALSVGFKKCNCDFVVVLDADLQDPPELINEMLLEWEKGYDVVSAVRSKRDENIFKKVAYFAFYRILKFMSSIDIHMDSGDFCLYDKKVIDEINNLTENLKFFRGLRCWIGFKHGFITYERKKREFGKASYNFAKLYDLATDGLTSMSIKPLKIAQFFSLFYLCIIFFLTIFISFKFINTFTFDYVHLLMLLCLFSFSLVMACIYILGAYVGRIYLEVKNRPSAIIRDEINVTKFK